MKETPQRGGLLTSLRALLATLVETVQVRLELLGTELAEEKQRLLQTLALGAAACFLIGAGAVFLATFITVLVWDEHRLLALGLFAAIFLGGGIAALAAAVQSARASSQVFSASLAELAQDRRELDRDR